MPKQMYSVKRTSILSGATRTRNIVLDIADYEKWMLGRGNIQDLMPYLSDSEREFIKTGITDAEWDEAFAEEPDQ